MSKPDTEEAKEEHQIQIIKAKGIIIDSIRDHLIPILMPMLIIKKKKNLRRRKL